MSEPLTQHPTAEDLAAFAERRSTDVRRVEVHLDICPECLEVVVGLRRTLWLQAEGKLPELDVATRESMKHQLRSLIEGSATTKPGRRDSPSRDSKASPNIGGGILGGLGALFAGWSLTHDSTGGLTPALGDQSPLQHDDHPHSPQDDHHPVDPNHHDEFHKAEPGHHDAEHPDHGPHSDHDAGHDFGHHGPDSHDHDSQHFDAHDHYGDGGGHESGDSHFDHFDYGDFDE